MPETIPAINKEEKCLVAAVVNLRNVSGPTNGNAILILLIYRDSREKKAAGIERIIAEDVECGAVKPVGPGARGEKFDAASCTSVFGVEVCAEKLKLPDRFNRGPGFTRNDAAAFDACGSDSIHQNFFRAAWRSADLCVACITRYAWR